MRLILHIGNHKAGSTSIQTAMSNNLEELQKANILYPSTGLIKNAHHIIPLSLRGVVVPGFDVYKDVGSLLVELIEEVTIKRPGVVIISSEEFFLCSNSELSLLKPFFSLFNQVDLVCVLRNQLQHIESGYKFSVLWDVISETRNFDDYLEENLSTNYHRYDEKVAELYSYSEINQFIVLDFNVLINGGELVGNFLRCLQLDTINIPEIDNNKSLTRMATLGVCLFNNKLIHSVGRKTFIKSLEEIFQSKESFYNESNYEKVIKEYESSNIKLHEISGVNLSKSTPDKSGFLFGGGYFRPRDIALLYISVLNRLPVINESLIKSIDQD